MLHSHQEMHKHARPSSTTMEAVKSSDQARLHTGVAERTGNSSVNVVHDHRGESAGKRAGPPSQPAKHAASSRSSHPGRGGELETSKRVRGLQVNNWCARGELSWAALLFP